MDMGNWKAGLNWLQMARIGPGVDSERGNFQVARSQARCASRRQCPAPHGRGRCFLLDTRLQQHRRVTQNRRLRGEIEIHQHKV